MDFDLSEEQQMLVETVTAFVKKQSPVSRARALREDPVGWSPAVWKQMGEFGWLGASFPEQLGGAGGSFVDAMLILVELGTTLVPEPYLSTLVAAEAVLKAGDVAHQRSVLAPVIAGERTLALAFVEVQSRYDAGDVRTRADGKGAGYRLSGTKRFVLPGHVAETLVISARADDGLALFLVDKNAPGLVVQPVQTLDGRRAAMLHLDGVEVAAEARLPGDARAALEAAMDIGAAGACAEGVGILRAVLAMTTEYLRTREQFGVKIGTFQVLQHRAVDMFIETELCRSMAILAGLKVGDPDPGERMSAVSAAKVQLAVGGKLVTQQAIQLHGGIGVTDEHDVGLYFKRMHVLNSLYGDEQHHLTRFAAQPQFTQGTAPPQN